MKIPGPPAITESQFIVLLVGQSLDNTQNLATLLQESGIQLLTVTIPEFDDVSQQLLSLEPDITIIDLGNENPQNSQINSIYRFVKSQNDETKIITISNHNTPSLRKESVNAGSSRFLPRPFDAWQLVDLVQQTYEDRAPAYRAVFYTDDPSQRLSSKIQALELAGFHLAITEDTSAFFDEISQSEPDIIFVHCSKNTDDTVRKIYSLCEHEELIGVSIMLLCNDSGKSPANPQTLNRLAYISGPDENVDRFLFQANALAKNTQYTKHVRSRLKVQLYERNREHIALNMHALVSIADTQGNITYANDKFCNISGYSLHDLIGSNHRVVKSGHHNEEFYINMWQTISSGKVWQGVICNRKRNGNLYWVDSTIIPFLGENGSPYQYVSIRTNITEQKQAQKELSQSVELLETTNDAALIGHWEIDLESMTPIWSRVTRQIHEVDENFVPNLEEAINFYKPGESRDTITTMFNDAVKNGKNYDVELEIITFKGNTRWVRAIGIPEITKGSVTRIYGLFQDITERKRVNLDLMRACEEANAANRAKSYFLASMSHELRTPMNAILGFAQLLKNDPILNDDQNENVGEILEAGQHLLGLINDVLDLSKVESGTLKIQTSNFNVSKSIEESLNIVKNIAEEKQISIVITGEKDLSIDSDFKRFKQVFVNLLTNAIKYNRNNGDVKITIENNYESLLKVSVTDNGIGIPDHKKSNLFKPFSRLGLETSTVEGAGIGLAFSRRLVELLGGKIGFESTQGVGSTFWFTVPISEHIFKVLYIEDNIASQKLVEQILSTKKNIQFLTCNHPQEGISMIKSHHPELVLLDVTLPTMDGYQVLSEIKSSPEFSSIPIVGISARAKVQDIQKAESAGFDRYLTKPINMVKLIDTVEEFIG